MDEAHDYIFAKTLNHHHFRKTYYKFKKRVMFYARENIRSHVNHSVMKLLTLVLMKSRMPIAVLFTPKKV